MKKILCLTIVLLLSLSAFGFAQHGISQGRALRVPPVVSLSVSQSEFAVGEPVQFTLHVAQGPLLLQGCYYLIERQVGYNSWAEFYRSSQNPFGQAFLAPNTEQSFSWGQANAEGSQKANPGSWRINFFVPGASTSSPIIANFTILAGGGGGGQGQPAVTIKCMRNKLRLGEKVTFRLENVSGSRADLTDCYYVIERHKNNRWLEWMSSGVNPFDFRFMNPGEIYKWDWNQTDGHGHRTEPGDWRIVFYAPRLPDTPVSHAFDIR